MANTNSLDLELSSSQYAYITDANQTGLDITGDISIECWVKVESLSSTISTIQRLVGKWGTTDNKRAYCLYLQNEAADQNYSLNFGISSDGTFAAGTVSIFYTYLNSSGTNLITASDIGQWVHLAVTLDVSEKSAVFYKNGTSYTDYINGTYNGATSIGDTTSNFEIGANNTTATPAGFFDGLIDDVRVWSDIRTAQEIADNYNKELVGNEDGLVGYWKFNEGSGTTAYDETSNNNDLTLAPADPAPVYSTDTNFDSPSLSSSISASLSPSSSESNSVSLSESNSESNSASESVGSSESSSESASLSSSESLSESLSESFSESSSLSISISSSKSLSSSSSQSLSESASPSAGDLTNLDGVSYTSSLDSITLLMDITYPDEGTNCPVIIGTHGYNQDKDDIPQASRDKWGLYGCFVAYLDMRGRNDSGGSADDGGKEIYDIYDAIQYIKANYASIIDETNINFVGGSGAGGNALSSLTKIPDSFGYVVDHFGMSDYGYDNPDGWWYTNSAERASLEAHIGGTPAAVPDNYRARQSVIAVKNNSITKVRIYHDTEDVSVPVINTQNWQTEVTSLGYTNYTITISDAEDEVRYTHDGAGTSSAEAVYVPEILAGTYPVPDIATTGTWHILSFVKTDNFRIFLGNPANSDSLNDAAPLTYDISGDLSNEANKWTWVINNNDTANSMTVYFQVYGLANSTDYRVRCYNVTDSVYVSNQTVASSSGGILDFDDAVAGSKEYRWEVLLLTGVNSPSESSSESSSESLSISISSSESSSLSISESASESETESASESSSFSASLSESSSESSSTSLSQSPSSSESFSASLSESLSESVSNSSSISLSESPSESISASSSESASESLSESISESLSESISESASISLSPSVSESLSISLSLSESSSLSASISLSFSVSSSPSADAIYRKKPLFNIVRNKPMLAIV